MAITYITRFIPEPFVPVAVLELNEDLNSIRQIKLMLERIDPRSVADDSATGRKNLRAVTLQIRLFERYAEQKMRTEFLAPRKKNERRGRKRVQ